MFDYSISYMRRNRGAVNYASGMATSPTSLKNMYIYGGGLISVFTLWYGILTTGNIDAAVNVLLDFYVMRLIPWPIDEILVADTMIELVITHLVTIGVGLFFAASKWWASV